MTVKGYKNSSHIIWEGQSPLFFISGAFTGTQIKLLATRRTLDINDRKCHAEIPGGEKKNPSMDMLLLQGNDP